MKVRVIAEDNIIICNMTMMMIFFSSGWFSYSYILHSYFGCMPSSSSPSSSPSSSSSPPSQHRPPTTKGTPCQRRPEPFNVCRERGGQFSTLCRERGDQLSTLVKPLCLFETSRSCISPNQPCQKSGSMQIHFISTSGSFWEHTEGYGEGRSVERVTTIWSHLKTNHMITLLWK